MPKANKLVIPIEADAKAAIAQLEKIGIKAKQAGDEGSKSFNMMTLKATAMTAAMAALTAGISKAVTLFAEMEQQQIAFEVLAGSIEKGRDLLEEVVELGRKTPFTTREVVRVSKQLLAFGFEAKNLIRTITILGDISSAVGRDKLGLIAKALADVKNKGYLAGQEFKQFGDNGVPLMDLLAKHLGKTRKEITELRESAEISFKDVYGAMEAATKQGGLFADMMGKQNATAAGQWSEAIDNVEAALRKLGEKILDKKSPVYRGLRDFNLVMGRLVGTQKKELTELEKWLKLSKKERKELKEKALAAREANKAKAEALKLAKQELKLINEAIAKQKTASEKVALLSRDKAIRDKAKDTTVGGRIELGKVPVSETPAASPTSYAKQIIEQEKKIQEEKERTAEMSMVYARASADFAINQGQRLMYAADGQSRAMFNIGKALNMAKIAMDGKAAVIETYKYFGYPWGIIPAGIMTGIYLSQLSDVSKMTYNSGSTPNTSIGVNNFSSPALSLQTGNTNAVVFDDLNSGILGIQKELKQIKGIIKIA